MSLISAISSSIARLGGEVAITAEDSRQCARAIVEPLRRRSQIYIGGEMRSLGQMSRDRYLFIGTPDIALMPNRSVIESVGGKYIVKRCETYFVRDKAVYVWAILTPYGDCREDEYEPDL